MASVCNRRAGLRIYCANRVKTWRQQASALAEGGFSWADKRIIFVQMAEFGNIAMGGRLWYNELVHRNRTGSRQELVESNCRPFGCRQGGAFII